MEARNRVGAIHSTVHHPRLVRMASEWLSNNSEITLRSKNLETDVYCFDVDDGVDPALNVSHHIHQSKSVSGKGAQELRKCGGAWGCEWFYIPRPRDPLAQGIGTGDNTTTFHCSPFSLGWGSGNLCTDRRTNGRHSCPDNRWRSRVRRGSGVSYDDDFAEWRRLKAPYPIFLI